MSNSEVKRSGGQVLVDALRVNGVERAFCVPGESYLAVLDALHDVQDEIDLIVCRQEGGAAYMAEAYGKLTGKPGICFVTRGPGATNASVGVHTAFQDSTPMLLFIGQVARDQIEREAFQEVDYRRMFGQMAKWVVQIDDAARIPELVNQAFQRAISGRPGPVVIALPEDMLTDLVQVADARPAQRVEAAPAPQALGELQALLAKAQRPLVIAGGGGWNDQAVADLKRFVQAQHLPLAASFRCQDLFDNTDPHYAGDLGLAAGPVLVDAVKQSDLLIVVGARLGEMTTGGYALVDIPTPKQALVHVHASAEEIGRVYQPTLGINAGPASFLNQAATLPAVRPAAFTDWVASLNCGYRGNFETPRSPGDVQMSEVIAWLNKTLPADSILTCGAGNYTGWVHRGYQHRVFRTLLGPTNGSMGYGVPAAVAAKLTYPQRTVVAFAGDGCFLMNGQELATAVHYDARVITVVVNNGMYGTIRMHQERTYPGRVSGTELHNPDFAALARAYGLHGETVTRTEDFAAAFERCQASGKPALIDVQVDPEALTPRMTLSQIRDKALQAKR
ncbi:thiamine pyrophosphate-binding protein [Pseudomonas monteilii]|uniref:Thiamine pyrophosphate-binding protein n=2 Tax=Pseudomonas TaxID=286 RepID=A0A7W2LC79_9PSED|nr:MULTISPECIES: thiamine pyrophosphate-binding protein [Pseudomonas]AVH39214.1 thiamine pyrophosphate-binding protein [Pseudomonas monteilii]MBA6138255.1 thiamine pyrophosphate-binding protein [Pseudomonas monteilii]MBV4514864.1 thiamine pyrophosphate-binding protein [Pseudomonas kurunegalensis]MBZ3665109.1 thiamine pyrophosphate-binding protein [Pseudomonas monteilii]MBZ3670454.1 thiamine pyrophosphate-binding protein [Pseudomonas monteilii]